MGLEQDIERMGISQMKFITGYVLPLTLGMLVVGIAISAIVYLILGIEDLLLFVLIIFILPLIGLIISILIPVINTANMKSDIENYIHFFVTRIGTLSTAAIPPAELFKIMSKKKEYKTLANSCNSIYMRFAVWHIPLGQSFKIEARSTPSQIYGDFLERFASALEAGTSTEEFLRVEQINVMSDYVSKYRAALYNVDVVKEMFISIVIGLVFLMVFSILIPYLTCMDPEQLIIGSIGFFILVEAVLVYYLMTIIPKDELIYEKRQDIEDLNVAPYVAAGVMGAILIPAILYLVYKFLPIEIIAALAVTPLIPAANYISKVENSVKRSDLFFGEFITSFGHTIHSRGGAIKTSLKMMTFHDFGPMTEAVKNLYERMKMRADNEKPWKMFYVETGSRLIANFMEVFVETLMLGGKAKETCEMINHNFLKMIDVRKQRYNTSLTFRGILYALHGGIVFTAYASAGVVIKLGEMFNAFSFDMGSASSVASIICIPSVSSLQFTNSAMLLMMLINAFVFSIALKISDGGHIISGLRDFVIMVWIGAVLSIITTFAVDTLITAF